MTMKLPKIMPSLLISLALTSIGFAQNANQGRPPSEGISGPPASQTSSETGAPVLHIKSVEIIRSAHAPIIDIIRVRAMVSTAGWEEAELIPLSRGVPADGILELIMVARPPAQAAEATGFEEVDAIFPLESNHPFKGVNVHSASDSVSVSQLPGYVEGKSSSEDCSKCVGKTFVAKGATTPAAKSSADLVREEQLPAATRIVRPSEGIPNADSNPNRLTLILNREGKITAAVWD
jgi:hypothetical protein